MWACVCGVVVWGGGGGLQARRREGHPASPPTAPPLTLPQIFHELGGPVFPPRELRDSFLVQEILDRITQRQQQQQLREEGEEEGGGGGEYRA